MSTTTQTRRCSGTNKAGEPCRSRPLRGSELCAAHDRESPTYNEMFANGHQGRGGRPRKFDDQRALAEAIKDRAEELVDVAFSRALQGDTRLMKMLFAYGWGQPRQHLELTGAGGGPISIADVWAGSLNGHGASLN